MGKQALKGDMLTRRKVCQITSNIFLSIDALVTRNYFYIDHFLKQLGILNVIGTMALPGESVYPLYIAASVDRYALFLSHDMKYYFITALLALRFYSSCL